MDLVAIGDNVVDCYTQDGLMYPGGNALNVAVHGRRLGLRTGYVGAVGTDQAGLHIAQTLANEGIDTTQLRHLDGQSAYATVELIDGDRTFAGGDKGVSYFTPSMADLSYLAETQLLHTSCYSGLETHLASLSAQAPLSFDLSDRLETDYIDMIAPHCTFIELSAHESGTSVRDLLWRIRTLGPPLVLATRGDQGALLLVNDHIIEQPVTPINATDTLGAGDAFIASVLRGIVENQPADHYLPDAAAYAAQTCVTPGAFGYPTRMATSEYTDVASHSQLP